MSFFQLPGVKSRSGVLSTEVVGIYTSYGLLLGGLTNGGGSGCFAHVELETGDFDTGDGNGDGDSDADIEDNEKMTELEILSTLLPVGEKPC